MNEICNCFLIATTAGPKIKKPLYEAYFFAWPNHSRYHQIIFKLFKAKKKLLWRVQNFSRAQRCHLQNDDSFYQKYSLMKVEVKQVLLLIDWRENLLYTMMAFHRLLHTAGCLLHTDYNHRAFSTR